MARGMTDAQKWALRSLTGEWQVPLWPLSSDAWSLHLHHGGERKGHVTRGVSKYRLTPAGLAAKREMGV